MQALGRLRRRHHPDRPAHAQPRRCATTTARATSTRSRSSIATPTRSAQSPAVDKLFDWSVISPRLGATFKLNEAGTTLLKGSCGRYYRGIVTGEFDNATPSIAPRYDVLRDLRRRGQCRMGLELVTDNSQISDRLRVRQSLHRSVHRHLRAPAHRPHRPRVSGVYKQSDNQSGWRDIGGTYAPVTRDRRRQDLRPAAADQRRGEPPVPADQPGDIENTYKGFNFQLNKRMSNRWQGNFGLTLSKTDGRYGSNNARSASDDDTQQHRRRSSARTRTTTSTPTACCSATARCSSRRSSSTSSAGT